MIDENTDIIIRRVRDEWGWLGNMSPHPIEFNGVQPLRYPTSEHLFQALRFPVDSPRRAEIMAEKSPMGAKMLAKKHAAEMIIQPRSEQDVFNMKFVLLCKLKEHPALGQMLDDTGSRRIIEDCSRRPTESGLFWGAMVEPKASDGWWGLNKLGMLWQEIRAQRRGEYK